MTVTAAQLRDDLAAMIAAVPGAAVTVTISGTDYSGLRTNEDSEREPESTGGHRQYQFSVRIPWTSTTPPSPESTIQVDGDNYTLRSVRMDRAFATALLRIEDYI